MPFVYAVTNRISISDTDYKFEISYDHGDTWGSISIRGLLDEIVIRVEFRCRDHIWECLLKGKTYVIGGIVVRCTRVRSEQLTPDDLRVKLLGCIPLTRLRRAREAKGGVNQTKHLVAELKDHIRQLDPCWEDPEIKVLMEKFKGELARVTNVVLGGYKEIHTQIDKMSDQLDQRKAAEKPPIPTLAEVLSDGRYQWKMVGHNRARRRNIEIFVNDNGYVFVTYPGGAIVRLGVTYPSFNKRRTDCTEFDAGLSPIAMHALSEWIAVGHQKRGRHDPKP